MPDVEVVRFANEAFYQSFANRDFEAMDAMWSRKWPVSCIHPGWNPLYGREVVMEAWRRLMANERSPDIRCLTPRVSLYGDTAMVVCFERIGDDYLVASNVFVRENGRWSIVHHQAGPAAAPPEAEDAAETPETIN
jgi:hypothetical protein